MYLYQALKSYTNHILGSVQLLIQPHKSVFQYLYVPDLDFRSTLSKGDLFTKLQTRVDSKFEVVRGTKSIDSWAIGAFSRSGLSDSSVYGSRCTGTVGFVDNTNSNQLFQWKMAEMTVDSVFFCNSIYAMEQYEEVFHTRYSSYTVVSMDVPLLGSFDINFSNIRDVNFDRLDSTPYGTVSSFSFSQTVSFPVFSEPQYWKEYQRIRVSLFVENDEEPIYSMVLGLD